MWTEFRTDHPLTVKANQSGELTLGEKFPCLKHFFPCTEPAGNNVILQDIVGGVLLPAQQYAKPNAYSVQPVNALSAPLLRGKWTELNYNPTLVLVVGNFGPTGPGLTLGVTSFGSSESIVVYGSVASSFVTKTPNTTVATACTSPGVTNAVGLKIDFFGNLVSFQTNASNVYSENTGISMGVIKNMSNLHASVALASSAVITSLYGIAVFRFNNVFPYDLPQAIPWMVTDWTTNLNKTVWPDWLHLS